MHTKGGSSVATGGPGRGMLSKLKFSHLSMHLHASPALREMRCCFQQVWCLGLEGTTDHQQVPQGTAEHPHASPGFTMPP